MCICIAANIKMYIVKPIKHKPYTNTNIKHNQSKQAHRFSINIIIFPLYQHRIEPLSSALIICRTNLHRAEP